MIELKAVSKFYIEGSTKTTAVNNASWTIREGDFSAIMGPSGSGKSTLVALLALLDRPSSGGIYFNGNDVTTWSSTELRNWRCRKVGIVFQSYNLIDELSVRDNIALPMKYAGVGVKERTSRVLALLKSVRLTHRADHYPPNLSGGQKQRVAIARAMANDPMLILADEPTGNLDSSSGGEIMRLFSELNSSGITIVMVTHSSRDASYAKNIMEMEDGELRSPVVGS